MNQLKQTKIWWNVQTNTYESLESAEGNQNLLNIYKNEKTIWKGVRNGLDRIPCMFPTSKR